MRSRDLSEKESSELSILAALRSASIGATEKESLAKSRIGQGIFREGVSDIFGGRCAITRSTSLLTASHIKPWRDCTNAERLDPFNGLYLSPVYDRAFDAGLISFDKNGLILISEYFGADAGKLGIDSSARVALHSKHDCYLDEHRKEYFRGAKP